MTDREIGVYLDVADAAVRVGALFTRVLRGRETATFRYHDEWLEHPERYALDPTQLPLARAPFQTAAGQKLFGGIADSAPDRWGRNLILRRARREGSRRTLFESDFLLGVHDSVRLGAVRFKERDDGPFLASDGSPIPPLVRLNELLSASDAVQRDEEDADDLRLLLAPGSSLGGARPKASVIDADGSLAIAKFPAVTDDWPVVVWEAVALRLAGIAGIDVPNARLVTVLERPVLLVRRFDRPDGDRRAFLSAMAMIGASEGEELHSYLELADAIRAHGDRVGEDLAQLWRRMLFNVLVSNTDDHLRNHGFCRSGRGWALAPAYDLNPVPVDVKPRVHSLLLDEESAEASAERVVSVGDYFGLEGASTEAIVAQVVEAVVRWRDVARDLGLGRGEIDRMASAFEHDDLRWAEKLAH